MELRNISHSWYIATILYPLRQTAVFYKLTSKDTLPVYNIPFKSH